MDLIEKLSGYAAAKNRLKHDLPIARHRIKVARDDEAYWERYADKALAEVTVCEARISELTLRLLTCGLSHSRALRVITQLGL